MKRVVFEWSENIVGKADSAGHKHLLSNVFYFLIEKKNHVSHILNAI